MILSLPVVLGEQITQSTVRIPTIVLAILILMACVGLQNLCSKLHNYFNGQSDPPLGLEPVLQHLRTVDIGQGIPYVDYTPFLDDVDDDTEDILVHRNCRIRPID